jgi:hypothetical protein
MEVLDRHELRQISHLPKTVINFATRKIKYPPNVFTMDRKPVSDDLPRARWIRNEPILVTVLENQNA